MREDLPPPTCHLSRVMCHVSHVIVFFYFISFKKALKLVGGGSVTKGVTPSSLLKYPFEEVVS